ncbi:hypothetical protein FGG08_003736 [Glutinoglossum americanum]|uniref:Uncharacterized protein n=1 Tax=Glutinoglossum americanum TaxID=1670608 RepID=A0A9P8L3C5_9PEZI|nr:hypothetical protein FGG08_003736 [Glutinoglossum americanum]
MFLRNVFWLVPLASVASVSALYPAAAYDSPVGPDAASIPIALAQVSGTPSIPNDLSSGFEPDSIQLKVSYKASTNDAFPDGTALTKEETAKQPIFAFGDASGINTASSYVVLMVDTTSATDRTLHFLQTDFKANGDATDMSSSASPAFSYRAPLSMGESGKRQYTFLLFQQTPSKGFQVKAVPNDGSNFNVEDWQTANGLESAQAGISMFVSGSEDGSQTSQTSTSPLMVFPTRSSSTATSPTTSPTTSPATSPATSPTASPTASRTTSPTKPSTTSPAAPSATPPTANAAASAFGVSTISTRSFAGLACLLMLLW